MSRFSRIGLASVILAASCAASLRSPANSPYGDSVAEFDVSPFPGGALHVRLASDGYTVAEWIINDYAIPVAIDVERKVINLRNVGSPLKTAVLSSRSPLRLAVWDIADNDAHWNEHTYIQAQYGDPAAKPTPYVYGLPFAVGERHRLIQGFNSVFSHTGDDAFAVDFEMPRAARDGTVVAFNDQAMAHGVTPEFKDRSRANWIVVLHDDNTLGEYWHLQPHGVRVKAGQHVARGDVIGLSGFTGYTTAPHLHLSCATRSTDSKRVRTGLR